MRGPVAAHRAFFMAREDAGVKIAPALAAIAASLVLPAGASVLYKSIDDRGTVTFSDVPPPAGSRLLESREIGTPSSNEIMGLPPAATAMEEAFQMLDYDKALREANARVDMAEHALALARAAHARTPRPGLNGGGLPLAEAERIEFHQRDLRAARASLAELLRSRQLASGRPVK
jgi:hypothetical protein